MSASNTKFYDQFKSPQVMGILNVTPDSFSDGGRFTKTASALDRIYIMKSEGASIIDIGGESSRPGASPVSEDEELERVIPVLKKAKESFPDLLYSIDTTKYAVAEQALELGADFINDVSGLSKEPKLAELCAKHNAAYILMHTQGDPETMQQNPKYENVLADIYEFFEQKIALLKKAGVSDIIVDPGIGFGKTLEHNLNLIAGADTFTNLGYPVMIGASRKSMIGQLLNNRNVEDRLAGTLSVHYHALTKGAKILRVHDVKEASDSIRIFSALNVFD